MSVRQYIGARYVTKIYENTLDPSSAEWQASVNYEPLTLVTYNNGSYLSKKQVPASVGNPASNPTYWAQTGFYNGQILYLQNQIDAINSVLNIETKVACIGDSYGMKLANNWATYLKSDMLLDSDHFTNKCAGNAGFIGNTGAKTFLEQLQELTDKDTYTHIVIVGGFNDAYDANGVCQSVSDMQSAINTVGDYIRAYFPNAKTFLGFAANACNLNDPTTSATMRSQIAVMRNCYNWFGCDQSWCVMNDMQYVIHDTQYFDTSDVVYNCVFHPNSLGGHLISRCIMSYIYGGGFYTSRKSTGISLTPETGLSIVGNIIEKQVNDKYSIMSTANLSITFSNPIPAANSGTIIKIASMSHPIVYPNSDLMLNATVKAQVNTDADATSISASIIFTENDIKLWMRVPQGYTTAISSIVLLPFEIHTDGYDN